jgi:translation initiation factor 5
MGAEKDIRHFITFNSLFTIRILEEFAKYKSVFKSFVDSDGEEGTKSFMMAMVHFFIEQNPKLEIAIPTFLKFVYDADILSEDTLLKWEDKKFKTNKKSSVYNRKNEKTFKKKAEKFLTWLKEAEADEEEESESEEEKKELTEDELKAK